MMDLKEALEYVRPLDDKYDCVVFKATFDTEDEMKQLYNDVKTDPLISHIEVTSPLSYRGLVSTKYFREYTNNERTS